MTEQDQLKRDLSAICGSENVNSDLEMREFFARDLFENGQTPAVVVAPQNAQEVADIVKCALRHGVGIYARGGGMSYTNAFLPAREGAVMMDSARLDKIREINAEDLYATVEAGCTWKELDEALEPHGLRARFWGPFSGAAATVGGSTSNGSANNNSAKIGTSAHGVLGYEVVTGTGEILRTGQDAIAGHSPFFEQYGPNLTALFSSDAGALGIKTAVTLKLEKRPQALGGVSYAFDDFGRLVSAWKAAQGAQILTAINSMDAATADIRSGKKGLKADLQKLVQVVKSAHNPLLGLRRGVKVAMAGRRVFENAKFTAHFFIEADSTAMLAAKERELRRLVDPHGDEIPNAVISLMRLSYFADVQVARYDGQRMLPFHGVLPISRIADFYAAYRELIAANSEALEKCGITVGDVFSAVGTNAVLCEPVFYWPDTMSSFHRKVAQPEIQQMWQSHDDNPEARELVRKVKAQAIDLMQSHGAVHLQVGKAYPYQQGREAENASVLRDLKVRFDPDNILNPGALGFPI